MEIVHERFRITDGLLKKNLDLMVLSLRSAEPNFYAMYRSARKIGDDAVLKRRTRKIAEEEGA